MAEVPGLPQSGTDWSSSEVAAVVADYFAMFADELAGRPYVKAEHNRGLQAVTGRSDSSIEFKHRNISGVLAELGLPWLRGYRPLFNYQDALVAEIERYLPGVAGLDAMPAQPTRITDAVSTVFASPPPLGDGPSAAVMERLVRKFDPAGRDARNRALGTAGEEFVVEVERRRLHEAGHRDLAKKVEWVARDEGDGAGYDVRSIDLATGDDLLIEVKTTRGAKTTPFFVSRNEEEVSRQRSEAWRLYRVFEFAATPRIFVLDPPLDRAVNLTTSTWMATFR